MLCALIMAGGRGTRFWPASTENKPKQFLSLINDKTMLQTTVNRLLPYIPIDRIYICTSKQYVNICKDQIPTIPSENIIVEPIGKNTAPCIMLSTKYISEYHDNANIVVLPSDHIVSPSTTFINILKTADQFIQEKRNSGIITIGIKPNRPETGYGYIEQGTIISEQSHYSIYKVNRFVEKPNQEKAMYYLNQGYYFWNAGIFIFNSLFMIDQFRSYDPVNFEVINSLPSCKSDNFYSTLDKKYINCESISIDYAIMEKSSDIYMIPADFNWDDIGSWKALERYLKNDSNNNYSNTDTHFINSKNNLVFSDSKDIVLLDINDVFCINVNNKLIIGRKKSINKVPQLKEEID